MQNHNPIDWELNSRWLEITQSPSGDIHAGSLQAAMSTYRRRRLIPWDIWKSRLFHHYTTGIGFQTWEPVDPWVPQTPKLYRYNITICMLYYTILYYIISTPPGMLNPMPKQIKIHVYNVNINIYIGTEREREKKHACKCPTYVYLKEMQYNYI